MITFRFLTNSFISFIIMYRVIWGILFHKNNHLMNIKGSTRFAMWIPKCFKFSRNCWKVMLGNWDDVSDYIRKFKTNPKSKKINDCIKLISPTHPVSAYDIDTSSKVDHVASRTHLKCIKFTSNENILYAVIISSFSLRCVQFAFHY